MRHWRLARRPWKSSRTTPKPDNNRGFALVGWRTDRRRDRAIQTSPDIQPNYAKAHYDLGVALTGRGRIDEAIGHYQRALEIEPDYVDVLNRPGQRFGVVGTDRRGDCGLPRALKFQPDNAAAHHGLGLALAGCGRIDEAIGHYQRALEISPTTSMF